jgi:hypothetical protein
MKKKLFLLAITFIVILTISSSKGMINPGNILLCSDIWAVQYGGSIDGPVRITCYIGGTYQCPYCPY